MKIVIAGAGDVGFHLAKLLSYESHDITLIDLDKERLSYIEYKLDIHILRGNATSISVLKEANVNQVDLVIAVTSNEAINITICALAKRLGAINTIARIKNSEFIAYKDELNFESFGIDEMISTDALATTEIKSLLNKAAFNDTHEFEDGELTMVGVVLGKNAPFIGMSVKEAATTFSDISFMPIAIRNINSTKTFIPRGDSVFRLDDKAYFITLKKGVEQLYKLTGKTKSTVKNVMILGGSGIGTKTAKELCDNKFNIKIIEKDKERASELADLIPNALVVYGDGRDVELLEEENVEDMDAFLGTTQNTETNIMACLLAKSKNVKKTIALADNIDYTKLSQGIGVDTIVNKKLLAANSIFRYIRRGDVLEISTLNGLDAELLEFNVRANSNITKDIIRELDFPRNAIIGGVIRDGKGIIALGDFKIQENDKVVVCCFNEDIGKIEKLFD